MTDDPGSRRYGDPERGLSPAGGNADAPPPWPPLGPANTRRPESVTHEPGPTTGEDTPPAAPRRSGASLRIIGGVAVAAAIAGGAVSGAVITALDNDGSSPAASENRDGAGGPVLSVEQTSAVAEAAASARQSVVRIESTRRSGGGVEQDIGSGVVLDTGGHILTNAHVVLGTDSLKVVLSDGTERPAILVGHDFPFTDIAVLQVGPGKLVPLPMGDSSRIKPGETVVAIGNPLAEFDGTVTVGVISGVNRVRTFDGVRQDDLIQTDAAVNNGNSGGALVDLQGRFIGMPTAILRQSRSGQAVEGIAFALPAKRILDIANAVIASNANYPRPSLQVEHVDLTADVLARIARPPVREGALVASVLPGGAADQAGVQAGDVITRLGDTDINSEHPLFNGLMQFGPGDSVRVVLNRNGRIIEAEVRLAARS